MAHIDSSDPTEALVLRWVSGLPGRATFDTSSAYGGQRRRGPTAGALAPPTKAGYLPLPRVATAISHSSSHTSPQIGWAVPPPRTNIGHPAQGSPSSTTTVLPHMHLASPDAAPPRSQSPPPVHPQQTKLMTYLNDVLSFGKKKHKLPSDEAALHASSPQPLPPVPTHQVPPPPAPCADYPFISPARRQCRPSPVNTPSTPTPSGPDPAQHVQGPPQVNHTAQQPIPDDIAAPYAQHFTPVQAAHTDPVMTALSNVAYTNELLRKESTARSLGLRCLLDFLYDNFDAFQEASERVTGKSSRTPLRAVLREAAASLHAANLGPTSQLWVAPSPAAAPTARDPRGATRLVRVASFNIQGLDTRAPSSSNHLYNVAQTLHLARPDVVALQGVGSGDTVRKLAALLNLWSTTEDGTWMSAMQHSGTAHAVAAVPAFMWRDRGEASSLLRTRGHGWHDGVCAFSPHAPSYPVQPRRLAEQDNRQHSSPQPDPGAVSALCGVFTVHGQSILVVSALFCSQLQGQAQDQSPRLQGVQGHPPTRPPVRDGVRGLRQQVHEVIRWSQEGADDQSKVHPPPLAWVLAYSLDTAGSSSSPSPPGEPTAGGTVLSALQEAGAGHPLVDPNLSTMVVGQEHADNLCWNQVGLRHASQGQPGLRPARGSSGVLGVGHLAPPGHCSHHRLVWADLELSHALPSPPDPGRHSGYGLSTEHVSRAPSPPGGGIPSPRMIGGIKDKDPNPLPTRKLSPVGTYAEVVSGKGYGLESERPRTASPTGTRTGYGLDAESPRTGHGQDSAPPAKSAYGLTAESPRPGFGLAAESPKGGYGLASEADSKKSSYGLSSEGQGKSAYGLGSETAVKTSSYGLGSEAAGKKDNKAYGLSSEKPSSSFGLDSEDAGVGPSTVRDSLPTLTRTSSPSASVTNSVTLRPTSPAVAGAHGSMDTSLRTGMTPAGGLRASDPKPGASSSSSSQYGLRSGFLK